MIGRKVNQNLQTVNSTFQGELQSEADISFARHTCEEFLTQLGFADRADDAVLALSEIAGNSFRYGQAPVSFQIATINDEVDVTVHDSGYWEQPKAPEFDDDAEHGRGMFITEAVSDQVNITSTPKFGTDVVMHFGHQH